MKLNRRLKAFGWTGVLTVVVALFIFVTLSYQLGAWSWFDRRPLEERYRLTPVIRTDLYPVLNAPGQLESAQKTMIRCQVEALTGGGPQGGSSTLLTVVPEGTPVKTGDVLATLDASTFDEMYRQQIITVEQAKASHLQAELNYQITMLAVNEFKDGKVPEQIKSMEGSIALAQTDFTRAVDHLSWTKRMNDKGYASIAAMRTEQQSVTQFDITMKRMLMSYNLFQRFTLPMTEKSLSCEVLAAKTTLHNEELRLQHQVDRLELIKRQVEHCTIRAPHDGVLYYYKDTNPRRRTSTLIEEGMAVRQRQPLFYLPNLTEMVVQVALNESIVDRVRPGQAAQVRVEAIPKLVLEGHVTSVSQLPASPGQEGEDYHYFLSVVKLDTNAPGLKPGMSARADIALAPRKNVLAVPHEAVKTDKGKKVCFVAREDSIVQNFIKIGQETTAFVEVTDGVKEGDVVVLNPPFTRTSASDLYGFSLDDNPIPSPLPKAEAAKPSRRTTDRRPE
jgi:HlyD family secretion protein